MRETVSGLRADRSQSLLLSGNKLKLAVFGANVSGGCSMTSAEGAIKVEWAESKRIAQAAQEQFEAMAANFIAGYSALPLVGTPEQIVEGTQRMSDAGMDGITLSWVDYESGLEQFQEQILPLMKEAGLRQR